jgi:uroporphyrin-3 C-methyltransferase
LSPDAEYFLRTNLELKLEVARLALLRGEQAVFRQSLDDATTWLGEYFESGNTQVKSAIDTIAELRDGVKVSAPPDISESLRLLRQHRAASEPAR